MSIMGNVAGLGAVQPDWAQTDERMADFIRNKPDLPGMAGSLEEVARLARGALPRSGGTMEGGVHMGGNALTGLGAPEADTDAATKGYVDSHSTGSRYLEAVLTVAGWTGESGGPYTQRVYSAGIREEDRPHYGPVYYGDRTAQLAQKEAFALVDDLDTETDYLIFTCLEEKPQTELRVQLEVRD